MHVMEINDIKELIRSGQIGSGLEQFAVWLEGRTHPLEDEATALLAEFRSLERDNNTGGMDSRDFFAQRNRILTASLQLFRRVEPESNVDTKNIIDEKILTEGKKLSENGEWAAAVPKLEQALKANPMLDEAHFELAYAYQMLGFEEKAIDLYNKAVKINPRYATAWNNLGILLSNMDHQQEAIDCFGQAFAVQPDLFLALFNRAMTFYEIDDFASAAADFDQCIEAGYQTQEPLYGLRGVCREKTGDFEDAIEDLRIALKKQPDHAQYLDSIGLSYFAIGESKTAIRYFAKGIEAHPDLPLFRKRRGLIYFIEANYKEAERDLDTYMQADEGDAEVLQMKASCRYLAGDLAAAAGMATRAIGANPQLGLPYFTRGRVYYDIAQYDNAVQDLERAVALLPDDENARMMLADAKKAQKGGWFSKLFGK